MAKSKRLILLHPISRAKMAADTFVLEWRTFGAPGKVKMRTFGVGPSVFKTL